MHTDSLDRSIPETLPRTAREDMIILLTMFAPMPEHLCKDFHRPESGRWFAYYMLREHHVDDERARVLEGVDDLQRPVGARRARLVADADHLAQRPGQHRADRRGAVGARRAHVAHRELLGGELRVDDRAQGVQHERRAGESSTCGLTTWMGVPAT